MGITFNPFSGTLDFTGSGGGGTIAGSIAATQVAFGTAANTIGGSANFTFDGTSLVTIAGTGLVSGVLRVKDTVGDGENVIEGTVTGLNNGSPFGVVSDLSFEFNGSAHGGSWSTGYTDGLASGINYTGYSIASFTPDSLSTAFIKFSVVTEGSDAFDQKPVFGLSNDFSENGPLTKWMLQLVEGNGVFSAGYPDSVPLFGIGTDSTTIPGGILHARNPPTSTNLATNKARVVGLFEGRSDGQTGDLSQWKLTGGSVLAKIDKDGKLTLPAAGLTIGASLVTLGGSLTTSGAFASTFTMTAATAVTFPTTGTLATLAGTESLTNKRITKRVVTAADATSITPNTDSADVTYQANTQAAGTLTINADTGTPTNGQSWLLKIKSTNVQTFSWNAVYVGGTVALPTTTTGSSTIDNFAFLYDTVNSKWQFTGAATGY